MNPESFPSPLRRQERIAQLLAEGYSEAAANGQPPASGQFRLLDRLGAHLLRVEPLPAGGRKKNPKRQAAVAAVWAARSAAEREAVGQKIAAGRKGRRRSLAEREKTSASLRRSWAGKDQAEREKRTAPMIEAAARIDPEVRQAINQRASMAVRAARPEERRRRARKAAATSREKGTRSSAGMEAMKAFWATKTPEEISAIRRAGALKRWARDRRAKG